MERHHNLERLRELYLKKYEEALETGTLKLPTYLEDWKETMNDIEFKFYSDLKSIGVLLYPYYPVDKIFVDFANPFAKVAVIIQYKKSNENSIIEKANYLKQNDWTVYIMPSKAVAFSAEDLYKNTYPSASLSFDELESEDFLDFVNLYAEVNSECLVYMIQEKHFRHRHY